MFELPIEVKALLAFLVTQGIKALLGLFGADLAGKWAAVVAALVAAVLVFAEGLLALASPEVQDIIVKGLTLLAGILGAFGIHKTYAAIRG